MKALKTTIIDLPPGCDGLLIKSNGNTRVIEMNDFDGENWHHSKTFFVPASNDIKIRCWRSQVMLSAYDDDAIEATLIFDWAPDKPELLNYATEHYMRMVKAESELKNIRSGKEKS